MNTNLTVLKNSILADGSIDDSEVIKLREILLADGKIDEEEANFLFDLNNAVSSNSNAQSWEIFFVEAICDYLLNDEDSPNIIDEQESLWLLEKLQGDGKVDTIEKVLLQNLIAKATSIPETLKVFIQSNI